MIFLSPGVLWLLPLAALPLLAFVFRPRRGRTVAWGAGRFVIEAESRSRRGMRWRRVLHALLGVAAVLCLLAGAARPLIWSGASWWGSAAPEVIVVCQDRSPALAALGPDGKTQRQALIGAMQRRALPLAEVSRLRVVDAERAATPEVAVRGLAAYPGLTALDTAADVPRLLALALDRLEADAAGTAEIWLGTGELRSAWQPTHPAWAGLRERLDSQRQRYRVRWFRPSASRGTNLSLRVAGSGRDAASGAAWVRVALRGHSTQPVELRVSVNGVPSALVIAPWPDDALVQELPIGAAGDGAVTGEVRLPGDGNPADNTAYFAIGARRPQVAVIACSDAASARVAAAAVAPDPADPWCVARLAEVEAIDVGALADTALVVIDRLPQSAASRASLQAFVESGGVVFIVPARGEEDATWLGVTRVPPGVGGAREAKESPAASGPAAGLTGLRGAEGSSDLDQGLSLDHLWARSPGTLRGGAVLATWNDGRLLLVRAKAGRGAAVWCTAALDPEESNLADGVVLVALLRRLLAVGASRLDAVERRECSLLPPDPARRCVLPVAADADRCAGLKAGILRTQPTERGAATTLVLARPALCDDAAVVSIGAVRDLVGPALVADSDASAATSREASAALLYAAVVFLGLDLLLAALLQSRDRRRVPATGPATLAESLSPGAGPRPAGGAARPRATSAHQTLGGSSRLGPLRGRVQGRLALGIRVLGVLLAVVMACRPERVVANASQRGPVVLLLDDTGSMQAPDGDAAGATRARVAQRLRQTLQESLEHRGPVELSDFGAGADSAGVSDIHGALTAVLARRPAALVLLSDGAWNAGADPRTAALAAAAAGVPVFSVCVGRSEPLPTLRLAEFSVPQRVVLGDTVVVGFRIVNALPESWSGEVALSDTGTALARRQVTLPPRSERWESLRWRPPRPGTAALVLSVPVPPHDAVPDDNTLTAAVQIDREPCRVLLVDDRPRWEFRAALLALRADAALQVDALLLGSARGRDSSLPPDLRGEDVAADDSSRDRLREFPARDALAAYDVVIFGAVRFGGGTEGLPAPAAADLVRGVEAGGMGLILLPGSGAGPTAWAESPLNAVLPVSPAAADEQIRTRTPFQPQVTAEARGSGLMALGEAPDDDAEVWQQLPGLRHHHLCGPALPDSSVLATLPEARHESSSVPLVVFRRAGLGRVLYLGSDDLWRWRAPANGAAYARFWRGAVRAVARRSQRVDGSAWRVVVEGSPAPVGAPVTLHAIPARESADTALPGLVCTLRNPQGLSVRLGLAAGAAGLPGLSGQVVLPEAGLWAATLAGETAAVATVEVRSGVWEDRAAAARPEVLKTIADLSGGRSVAPDQAMSLADAVETGRSAVAETRRLRLWAQPGAVAAVVVLLGLGWALRGRGA